MHRSNNAIVMVLDSSRRLDAAIVKLGECIDKSSGVPIAEIDDEDSLVTSVSDLMQSNRAHRPERRANRVKVGS